MGVGYGGVGQRAGARGERRRGQGEEGVELEGESWVERRVNNQWFDAHVL